MSDQNARDIPGHAQSPYGGAETTAAPHRFVDQASSVVVDDDRDVEPQAGLGPYTLREWIVIALGLALAVLSFFSTFSVDVVSGYTPVWGLGITWLGAVFVPFAAVVLIALRRFIPRLRHGGALSLDQFASVAFAVAAFVWLNLGVILTQMSAAVGNMIGRIAEQLGAYGDIAVPFDPTSVVSATVIVWIAFVVALAGVFFTVFARFVPPFSADFAGREATPAHATARPVRPLAKRERPAAPAPAQAWPGVAPAPHGGPQPTSDPARTAPSAAPSAGVGVPPVPRPDGAAFAPGAPAASGPHVASSSAAQPVPPYAQNAPDAYGQGAPAAETQGVPSSHGQHSVPPYAQSAPAAYGQDAPVDGTQSAPSSYVQDAPADGTQGVPAAPEHDAHVPADEPPLTQPADAAPVAEDAPRETPAVADDSVSDATAAPEASGEPTVAFGAPPAESSRAETPAAETTSADDSSADEGAAAPFASATDPATTAAEATPQASAPAADAAPQAAAPAPSQPFWALAPVERDVHDFDGNAIYRIGPTAWALVLEDRGSYFVMRHDDGRIGYLHDTSGITRG